MQPRSSDAPHGPVRSPRDYGKRQIEPSPVWHFPPPLFSNHIRPMWTATRTVIPFQSPPLCSPSRSPISITGLAIYMDAWSIHGSVDGTSCPRPATFTPRYKQSNPVLMRALYGSTALISSHIRGSMHDNIQIMLVVHVRRTVLNSIIARNAQWVRDALLTTGIPTDGVVFYLF